MPGKAAKQLMVYRIVHFDNLNHILKNGIYIKGHKNFDPDYVNIGNSEIIGKREAFQVKINKYGYLSDYVPFYFGRQSIMLYNILTGHGGIKKCLPVNIIYLCCYVDEIIRVCPQYFFTDGQANKKFTEHFTDLIDLKKIDWDVIDGSDFKMTEDDLDKPRKYQAEFLVHQHVPVSCLEKIVVYNKARKTDAEALLTNNHLSLSVEIAKKNEYYFYF
jgi:hypothetical protein